MLLLVIVSLGCYLPKSDPNIYSLYIDNMHLSDYYIRNNRVEKVVFLDKKNNKTEDMVYQYGSHGELLNVDIKGDNSVSGINVELAIKMFKDATVQKSILANHNISIPLSDINTSELSDISYLLTSVEQIQDTILGSQRIVRLQDINQSFRFSFSYLESFISSTNIVVQYTLFLKNNVVSKEHILFDDGELERIYSWRNDKELSIETKCKYRNGDTSSMVKKIIAK